MLVTSDPPTVGHYLNQQTLISLNLILPRIEINDPGELIDTIHLNPISFTSLLITFPIIN